MNEIERKELRGLGGWLTLFQIYIIYGAANYGAAFIILPLMVAYYIRSPIFYLFDVLHIDFMPYFIAIIAISFVLLIVCMLLFYKRKMAFRTVFVIESAVMILCMIIFYTQGLDSMFGFFDEDSWFLNVALRIIFTASMHVAILPKIALVIALFKSKRVKNTFS